MDIAGRWVRNEDMHPFVNVAGRKYWAPGGFDGGGIEGVYSGLWPTPGGAMPHGLYWFFETSKEPTK